MSLASGTRLGPYEIVSAIGAGGMGEVYRARDTRLHRDVAIKVLPAAFAADPDRLARFEREAQTLAALNHPHVAHIHGVVGPGEGAPHALVMEFVEGEDLAQRLQRGPIPLDEALAIARQIAEALEAAHERHVIHRDLKPANVKLTPDGTVKVLDFGLAKALSPAETSPINPSNSPTFTSPAMTGMGVILGTAAYMSPEQAKGKPVDRRADIWAFGVVLYEMLTGRLLYVGETVTETIAQVITQPAALDGLPAGTPAGVRRILRRCLEKDPRNRFQSAGDVRIEIDELLASPTAGETPAATATRAGGLPPWAYALIALLAVALGLAIARPWDRTTTTIAPSLRLEARVDADVRLHVDENIDGAIAVISPDGQTLVYLGTRDNVRRLYVRPLDALESSPLSGTEGATGHFFSPDSQWVAFFSGGFLKKVPLRGGAPVTIAPAIDARGGTWSTNDVIVFAPNTTSGLHRVAASSGTPEPITTLGDGQRTHRWPVFLPDPNVVVFQIQDHDAAYSEGAIMAVKLDTKETKLLMRGGTYPRYLAGGFLTYVRENNLFAVPLDERSLQTAGDAQLVLSQVLESQGVGAGVGDGAAQVSFSNTGTAVVLTGTAQGTHSQLAVVDRTGKEIFAAPEKREYRSPRLSPDGTRIALQLTEGRNTHVHVFDIARRTMTKLTFDGEVNGGPVWSADGKRLAYFSDRIGGGLNVFTMRSDGGGDSQSLSSGQYITVPSSFSPDGGTILGMEQGRNPSAAMDVVVMSVADKKTVPWLTTRAAEMLPAFSPDGKWVAYQSDETGQPEVYVRPYPGPGGKWQVSRGGGGIPVWTKNGREIVYVNVASPDQVKAVEITPAGDTISSGTPQLLFEFPAVHPPNAWWFDASPDGTRFVVLKGGEQVPSGMAHFTLITNFPARVRRTER